MISDIQGAALAGMEAFVVTPRQCAMLDSAVARVGRVSMLGKAVTRNDSGEVVQGLSNLSVLRFWRIASSTIELSVRRLKWLQKMVAFPADYQLVISAIFGTTRGELDAGLVPTVSHDGTVNVGIGTSPWAEQLLKDFFRLAVLDDAASLVDHVGARLMLLFYDKNLGEEFAQIDVSQLRAREFSVTICPPGFEPDPLPDLQDDDPEGISEFSCGICKLEFRDFPTTLVHMKRAHGLSKLSYTATLTNQCPVCLEVFSTRISASRHLQNSLNKGMCCTSKTYNLQCLHVPRSLECPFSSCGISHSNLLDLQLHLAETHLSWVKPASLRTSRSHAARRPIVAAEARGRRRGGRACRPEEVTEETGDSFCQAATCSSQTRERKGQGAGFRVSSQWATPRRRRRPRDGLRNGAGAGDCRPVPRGESCLKRIPGLLRNDSASSLLITFSERGLGSWGKSQPPDQREEGRECGLGPWQSSRSESEGPRLHSTDQGHEAGGLSWKVLDRSGDEGGLQAAGERNPGVSCNQTEGPQQEDLLLRRGTLRQDCVPFCSDEAELLSGSVGGRRSDQLLQTDELGGDGWHCAKIPEGKTTCRAESHGIQAVTGEVRSSMSFTAGSMSDEIGSGHFGPFVTVAANSACTVYAKEEGAVTVHDEIDEECESLRDSEIFSIDSCYENQEASDDCNSSAKPHSEVRGSDPLAVSRVPVLGAGVAVSPSIESAHTITSESATGRTVCERGVQYSGMSGLGRSSSSILNSLPLPSKADLDALRRVPVLGAGVAGISTLPSYVSSAEIEATEVLDLAALCRVPVLGVGVDGTGNADTNGPDALRRVPVLGAGVAGVRSSPTYVSSAEIDVTVVPDLAASLRLQALDDHDEEGKSHNCIDEITLTSKEVEGAVITFLESDDECKSPHDSELFSIDSCYDFVAQTIDSSDDDIPVAPVLRPAIDTQYSKDLSIIGTKIMNDTPLNSSPGPSDSCLSSSLPGLSSDLLSAPPPPGLENILHNTYDNNKLDIHCADFDSADADPFEDLDKWLDDESTIGYEHHNLNSNPGPPSSCLSSPDLPSVPLAAPPPPGLEQDNINKEDKVDHHAFEQSNLGPGLIQQKGNTLEWRNPHDYYDRAKPSSSGSGGSSSGIGSRSLDVEMALFDQHRLKQFNKNILESRFVKAHAFSHSDISAARQKIAGSSSDIVSLSGKPNHFLVKRQQPEQQQQHNNHHDNF